MRFSFFSIWSWIMTHYASRREDLPAVPPGSPLALPLIYSLIHLRCCHMASLVLPPRSPSVLLLISQSCSSRGLSIRVCPCILPSLPSTFPFPSPSPAFCLPALLQQGTSASFASAAAVHSQGQRRSNLATVSD